MFYNAPALILVIGPEDLYSIDIDTAYLTPEDIELYRQSNTGVFSISVSAKKPVFKV